MQKNGPATAGPFSFYLHKKLLAPAMRQILGIQGILGGKLLNYSGALGKFRIVLAEA